ncbi:MULTISPECIES: recombination mediator RecR [Methylomonas]|uniref:Recombination protein RecR n=1 Tax=Methylomonas koyamae TaxID=702114 RepID=A0A177NNQ4_9GAMM|nr:MULTISPECIES: recombination mediator RecR [Methylomonas]ANE57046.1 recombination protein RecR [Methylomonas sp. DH-1]OAI19492.1 recombination protein RecR [Methylomonas koyamae]BBL60246.1 recombination protein RecR [Methylomonas koyamae]
MQNQGLLKELIQSLCCLPGVGPKSAQRMAFHLLQRNREGGLQLGKMLERAVNEIGHCRECRTLTEAELCEVCANPLRDAETLCVVESPADVWVVDQATTFKGKYFVLHGRLSPLDGIGPDQLGFDLLEQRMASGQIKEIILATNSTVEGQATAHFIADVAAKFGVRATRIAHGVPMGGELEFIDSGTLAHAFNGRREL